MASTHILATGTIKAGGEVDWHIAALQAEQAVVDGELQRLIEEAEALEEYREWIADQEFWSRGGW